MIEKRYIYKLCYNQKPGKEHSDLVDCIVAAKNKKDAFAETEKLIRERCERRNDDLAEELIVRLHNNYKGYSLARGVRFVELENGLLTYIIDPYDSFPNVGPVIPENEIKRFYDNHKVPQTLLKFNSLLNSNSHWKKLSKEKEIFEAQGNYNPIINGFNLIEEARRRLSGDNLETSEELLFFYYNFNNNNFWFGTQTKYSTILTKKPEKIIRQIKEDYYLIFYSRKIMEQLKRNQERKF